MYLEKHVFVGISTLLQALCLGGGRVGWLFVCLFVLGLTAL